MDAAQVTNDHLDQYLVIDDGDKFSLSGGTKELAFVTREMGGEGEIKTPEPHTMVLALTNAVVSFWPICIRSIRDL